MSTLAGHTILGTFKIRCPLVTFFWQKRRTFFPKRFFLILYTSLITPHLDYGILSWGGVGITKLKGLIEAQKKAVRNVCGRSLNAHTDELFKMLNTLKFKDLFQLNSGIFMYRYGNNGLPMSFSNMFSPCNVPNRTNSYKTIKSRISFLDQFPLAYLPRIWNNLSVSLKNSDSLNIFKNNY